MILSNTDATPLKHGGNLTAAAERYDIPIVDWLDMSTGVSPWSYPVGELGSQVWQNLPPPTDSLIQAARHYYQVPVADCIASPGSQIVIRLLPQCLEKTTVAVPSIGYQEHAWSWGLAGHELYYYDNLNELMSLVDSSEVEHAVLINPNNPTGEIASLEQIKNLETALSGTLVIDEAFIDPFLSINHKGVSSAVGLDSKKIIVLRSVGKFFGLAGLRVGFAIGSNPVLAILKILLQPWSISYASQVIAEKALLDSQWHDDQGARITEANEQFKPILLELCKGLDSYDVKHSLLFHTVFAEQRFLIELHESLAKKGVWTRLFNKGDDPSWLRFSLPSDINQVTQRLGLL